MHDIVVYVAVVVFADGDNFVAFVDGNVFVVVVNDDDDDER